MINLNFVKDVHVSNGATEYISIEEKCQSVVECNCAIDPCTINLYMINLNFVKDVHVSNGATEYNSFKEKYRLRFNVMVPLNTLSLKKNAFSQLLLLYNLLTNYLISTEVMYTTSGIT
jgi:hypothetical protein